MGKIRSEKVVLIECDGCKATIVPHKEITDSGWMKYGVFDRDGSTTSYACPECWAKQNR